jgi:hypothetical protein
MSEYDPVAERILSSSITQKQIDANQAIQDQLQLQQAERDAAQSNFEERKKSYARVLELRRLLREAENEFRALYEPEPDMHEPVRKIAGYAGIGKDRITIYEDEVQPEPTRKKVTLKDGIWS